MMKPFLGYACLFAGVLVLMVCVAGALQHLTEPVAAAEPAVGTAEGLASELMAGDYRIEATAGPYVAIVSKHGVLYRCSMHDVLTACRQISALAGTN